MDSDDVDSDEALNICPICDRAFSSVSGLRQHWSKGHTADEIGALIEIKTQENLSQLDPPPAPDTSWNKLQVIKDDVPFQQFDIIENAGNGDCLFNALLDFLHRHKPFFKWIPHDATELRANAVDHIVKGTKSNFDRFKDSILENLKSEIADWSTGNASAKSIKQNYLDYMTKPGNYGTTAELCAIAELFGFRFNIVRRCERRIFTCYDYGSITNTDAGQSTPLAHLLFTGDISRGHFRLLVPVSKGLKVSAIPFGNYELNEDFTSSKLISIALARPTVINTTQVKPTNRPIPAPLKETSSEGFTCDFCGRSFDTRRGLSVHRNHHLNEPAKDATSNSADLADTDTTFDDFVILLARCKSNVRVLKRVPRGARVSAANKLAQCVEECLTSPRLTRSWKNLLTFSYTALRVPDKVKNSSLSLLVKTNIEKARLVIPDRSRKKRVPISLSKRVECKIAEGNVKGAVKLLASSDALAPQTLDTFVQLQNKHPPPSKELNFPDPPDTNADTLVVSEKDVFYAIKSFPNGSGSGVDGLLPQYLKDLTLPSTGEAGLRLLRAVTGLSNYMLSGKIESRFIEIMYGASLCALEKKQGGLRPIAVGNTFRRITSKLSSSSVRSKMAAKFAPRQIGFGVRGGCEAAAHATRTFIKKNSHRNVVVVKIDFRNAFNEVDRDAFLKEMKTNCPGIFPYLWQCYAAPTLLFYGDYILLSQNGVQQGDPCGPLVFSAAIQAVVDALVSEFVVFYLDDGTIAGEFETVLADFKTVIIECAKIGLHINPTKCELFFCSDVDRSVVDRFNELSPGICVVNEFTLLGAPISDNAFEHVFSKKLDEIKLLFKRLLELDNHHIAFYILKNCFAIPKLVFLLRSTPTWNNMNLIDDIDSEIRSTLQSLLNSTLDVDTWILASLPVNSGGIGVRRVQDTALPAFLSSVTACSQLVSTMLQQSSLQVDEIADYRDGLNVWNSLHPGHVQPEIPSLQRQWSKITVERLLQNLKFESDEDRARFLAIQKPESGAWLQALPSNPIGTLLENNAFRIAIGLRLGTDICSPHVCRCGSQVDSKGRHGLKCRSSVGRQPRHSEFNSIIKRALVSADVPAALEPVGLAREDGKRVDGMTLIPWSRGSTLIWDATCTDTFAPSNLRFSTREAGRAAEDKARRKTLKYQSLINQNYLFVPFSVETMGPWCNEAIEFFDILTKKIATKTHEPRSRSFLQQRLSMAIQRGNVAAVMGTFRSSDKLNEIFYIL